MFKFFSFLYHKIQFDYDFKFGNQPDHPIRTGVFNAVLYSKIVFFLLFFTYNYWNGKTFVLKKKITNDFRSIKCAYSATMWLWRISEKNVFPNCEHKLTTFCKWLHLYEVLITVNNYLIFVRETIFYVRCCTILRNHSLC